MMVRSLLVALAILAGWSTILRGESAEDAKITPADRAFWSFQPLADVQPPQVEDEGWSRNGIDPFVFQKLAEEGIALAAEADRRTLIRRAYLDLLGLPPTPEQVAAFVSDPSPRAYEHLIDRLLDTPQYGERWARHWLDLVRYAESDGFKQDAYRPHAWRYRDYVINALNNDKPYTQFVMEQLAGDEIAPHDPQALVATGYLRHWIYEYNQRDVRTQWSNILNDVTDVTADVFLGLGMGCARCHDHKFDPILQTDYYRLQAFFAPFRPQDNVPIATPQEVSAYQQQLAEWEEKTAALRDQIAAIEQPHRERAAKGAVNKFPPDVRPIMHKQPHERTPLEQQIAHLVELQIYEEYKNLDWEKKLKGEQKEQWDVLQKQLASYDYLKPDPLPQGMTVTDVGPVAPDVLHPRHSESLEPGFPLVLTSQALQITPPSSNSQSTGRRTALAQWISSPDNALATRVIVNRIWQYHFGRGLVETPSDFGRLGQPPSHPELLDYLSKKFIRSGGSFKHMHRLIMGSATYRQTALRPAPKAAQQKDPEARWLWRAQVRRLDAEQIRDAMLSVTGELDLTMGGPSSDSDEPRRSIYIKLLRNQPDPLLSSFDAPDGFSSTATRNCTTTPTQSLLMINSESTLERAAALAQRLQREGAEAPEDAVERLYALLFQREPTGTERAAALEFLQTGESDSALTDLCHVLLNCNEFLYID